MQLTFEQQQNLLSEATFKAVRSSGPGGQNVNKVSSKIEIRFNIANSGVLSVDQKELLQQKLAGKITNEGDLILTNQNWRSQLKNKLEVSVQFLDLIQKCLRSRKKRIATKPTGTSIARKAEHKKRHSEKKRNRQFKSDES